MSLGAAASAGAAIWGAVVLLVPLAQSGPLPFPGREEVNSEFRKYAQSIGDIQKQSAAQTAHQQQTDQNLDFITMQLLEDELDRARKDARANPNSREARAAVQAYLDRINVIRVRNTLPPLPP